MTENHSEINIACFVFTTCIYLSMTITFFVLMHTTEIFTVPGKLNKIQSCYETCYTNGVEGGCINSTVLAFDWVFQNNTYNITGFKCGTNTCNDCCYRFLNHTIQVEIDPKNPSVPIRFWNEYETPYSMTYSVLGVVCGVATVVLLGIACQFLVALFRHYRYEQM